MHVAASYGRTDICQWLYEKAGAEESVEQMGNNKNFRVFEPMN